MSWIGRDTQLAVSQQLSAHAAERRCDNCGRKSALNGYGVCRYVAQGKCTPQ